MSIIKKIDTFSSDDRGEIIDIFSKDPKEHCTIVTFNKNAVRGNHYHKKSVQSAYVLEGNFKIFNVKIDKNSSFDPKNVEEIDTIKIYVHVHINNWNGKKNIIFITHFVVISELLNIGVSSGEIIVVDKNLNIIERIKTLNN